ncbi:MAG TPA: L-aspartate oxidase [Planctomycetes bacterium]|nr:L-aspartate oxidase [Planctomycetota bacterium]
MSDGYIVEADLRRVPALWPEVVIVGGGVAGLSAALAAADAGAQAAVLVKQSMTDSNTFHAQGGIAVAVAPGDSVGKHVEDTLAAGADLCREEAVRSIIADGPERLHDLLEWGAIFDRDGAGLAFGREGAHSFRRIVHAAGDQTGRELVRVLQARVEAHPRVSVLQNTFSVDLLHSGGAVWGVLAVDASGGLLAVYARATVLATGGVGAVYRESTNPEVASGDGIAMAARAGALLEDLEFVQFHPTTLYMAGVKRHLISEAVRGEGAYLLNTRRERFMGAYHSLNELAPRDIVSRAILSEMSRTNSPHVYLDLRHIQPQRVLSRFPGIAATCSNYGLDITKDLVPVRPAAHYFMGGIRTDMEGRTNVERLFACGECACTGLHGANRLASNSLLEGLVMGRRAGLAAVGLSDPGRFPLKSIGPDERPVDIELDVADMAASLRSLMWRQVGIIRSGDELASALRALHYWRRYVLRCRSAERGVFVLRNMLTVAVLMSAAAFQRGESRGAHYRTDFPNALDEWRIHQTFALKDVL